MALDPPWQVQFAAFLVMGIGFYLAARLHPGGGERAVDGVARDGAVAALAVLLHGALSGARASNTLAFAYLGASPSVLLGGVVILAVGLMCARFLRRRRGDV